MLPIGFVVVVEVVVLVVVVVVVGIFGPRHGWLPFHNLLLLQKEVCINQAIV
jgi:hypothetical protein